MSLLNIIQEKIDDVNTISLTNINHGIITNLLNILYSKEDVTFCFSKDVHKMVLYQRATIKSLYEIANYFNKILHVDSIESALNLLVSKKLCSIRMSSFHVQMSNSSNDFVTIYTGTFYKMLNGKTSIYHNLIIEIKGLRRIDESTTFPCYILNTDETNIVKSNEFPNLNEYLKKIYTLKSGCEVYSLLKNGNIIMSESTPLEILFELMCYKLEYYNVDADKQKEIINKYFSQ